MPRHFGEKNPTIRPFFLRVRGSQKRTARRLNLFRYRIAVLSAFAAAACVVSFAVPAQAFGNTTANNVLGQVDFTHNGANIATGQGLNAPAAVAIDRSVSPSRIYVADPSNNRVLGWNNASAFANGQAATLEIGQPDFLSAVCSNGGVNAQSLCNPTSVAVDSAGNLYIADTGNN